jgi:hypothetical protein
VLVLKKQLTSTMEQDYDKVSASSKYHKHKLTGRMSNTVNSSSKAFTLAPSNSPKLPPMSFTSLWISLEIPIIPVLLMLFHSSGRLLKSSQISDLQSQRSWCRRLARLNQERCLEGLCGLLESTVLVDLVSSPFMSRAVAESQISRRLCLRCVKF